MDAFAPQKADQTHRMTQSRLQVLPHCLSFDKVGRNHGYDYFTDDVISTEAIVVEYAQTQVTVDYLLERIV